MNGMMGADLIKGPVGMVIGLVVWLIVFPLVLSGINGWYLQSVDAGVVSGERFDRVVAVNDREVEDAWQAVTGETAAPVDGTDPTDTTPDFNTAYLLSDSDSGDCAIDALYDSTVSGSVREFYTPGGTEVTLKDTGATENFEIGGCEFQESGEVFNAGGLSGLIKIVLQAGGLAPPIAVLFALGTFGTSFMKNMGNHPIMAAVLTVIAFLLLATLLNTFIPYVSDAFEALDANRYVMYSSGLGNVATVVGNFFGVVIVASMMMVAWTILKTLRGRNAYSGGSQSM